ncbi:hypothetical protein [Mitsuaria sp. BK037]|uniref:hypothetical protein n=1 Tax=Mitsuaria sp. BK037 TaxID=2587122 RepID=UPI0016161157|nr:hypothetical protein [Mitsuaria sp. BK037]MBB3282768.1 hypothetical protein [Mitsuaria sp. BK037]
MRMHVVTDPTGKIIAATHASRISVGDVHTSPGMQVELRALEGQKIHEVEVPTELQALHPHERLRAVLKHAVHASGTYLEPINETKTD